MGAGVCDSADGGDTGNVRPDRDSDEARAGGNDAAVFAANTINIGADLAAMAAAATLFREGLAITTAADVAKALAPIAGDWAGLGLLLQ